MPVELSTGLTNAFIRTATQLKLSTRLQGNRSIVSRQRDQMPLLEHGNFFFPVQNLVKPRVGVVLGQLRDRRPDRLAEAKEIPAALRSGRGRAGILLDNLIPLLIPCISRALYLRFGLTRSANPEERSVRG